MKIKNLFSIFTLLLLIFSCSPEDENETNNEVAYTIHVLGELDYDEDADGIFITIPIEVRTNASPTNVSVRFTQNGQQVGAAYNSLVKINSEIYRFDNDRWNIGPGNTNNGLTNAEIFIVNSNTNGWQQTGIITSFDIQWPDDIEPGDPEPDTESVTFTTIERVVNISGDVIYRCHYMDNSNTNGSVQIDLWKGGANQNLTINRSLIQTDGFVDSDPMQGILNPDENYQFKIINPPGQNPEYVFLDDNGNRADSHVFGFTAEANPPVVTVNSLTTDNITDTSFHVDLSYVIDTTDPQTLAVRLFESTDLDTPITEQEQTQQTTGNEVEIFSSLFTGLNPNTEYTFRYYLDDVQIFQGAVSTANNGNYRTEIENFISAINDVTVTAEYDNSTGADISATIQFLGTAVNGGLLEYNEPAIFLNGNMNTDIVITKSGFRSNSDVTANIIVNGVIEKTQTITTMLLMETSYQLDSGLVMEPNPNEPDPSPATIAATALITTNGDGETDTFNLRVISTNGLNPNAYISYVQINNGQQIAANWAETSSGSGIWKMNINQNENLFNGVINSYAINLGTESYMVIDPTGFDMFSLSMTITDDNGTIHGQSSNSVNLSFGN